ncbi:MAG: lipoyl(octanoyl) transferase LipB [Desulfobulbaceae bacterium]|nr:lipoyl(octanoyl) transferase LipB [Desulfobulbaceae bacterium]
MPLRLTTTKSEQESLMKAYLIDLGKMNYRDAHQFQVDCVQWRLLEKERSDIFLVTEHPPVFTLGKRGGRGSLTVGEEFIKSRGVDIVQTERGGDITYHGPGQIVVYPIVHLREAGLSVKSYVDLLEEVMIATAADFGVKAGRDERNRGIWVANNKIGSIGIRVRHGVSFHGLAFNATLDFEHFSWIQPCGLAGVGVTSVARESKGPIDFSVVKNNVIGQLGRLFNRQFTVADKTLVTGGTV